MTDEGDILIAATGILHRPAYPDIEGDATVRQINDAATKGRQAADKARKRAAQLAIVTALAMFVGAFIAGVASALGGWTRDEHELTVA